MHELIYSLMAIGGWVGACAVCGAPFIYALHIKKVPLAETVERGGTGALGGKRDSVRSNQEGTPDNSRPLETGL